MHDDSSRKIGDGNAGLDASWYVEMPSSDVRVNEWLGRYALWSVVM